MSRKGYRARISGTRLVVLAASALVATLAWAAAPSAVVSGGGQAVLDDAGTLSPLQLSVGASIAGDGSAVGEAGFVFAKPFAEDWAAVPGVDLIRLRAELNAGEVFEDGSVLLQGEFVEIEVSFEDGVVFVEKNTAVTPIFNLLISPDGNSMVLQWCELPAFAIELARGRITINTH